MCVLNLVMLDWVRSSRSEIIQNQPCLKFWIRQKIHNSQWDQADQEVSAVAELTLLQNTGVAWRAVGIAWCTDADRYVKNGLKQYYTQYVYNVQTSSLLKNLTTHPPQCTFAPVLCEASGFIAAHESLAETQKWTREEGNHPRWSFWTDKHTYFFKKTCFQCAATGTSSSSSKGVLKAQTSAQAGLLTFKCNAQLSHYMPGTCFSFHFFHGEIDVSVTRFKPIFNLWIDVIRSKFKAS